VDHVLFELGGFRLAEELAIRESLRPLERRNGPEVPDATKVRAAPLGFGRVFRRRRRRRRQHERRHHTRGTDGREHSTTHSILLASRVAHSHLLRPLPYDLDPILSNDRGPTLDAPRPASTTTCAGPPRETASGRACAG